MNSKLLLFICVMITFCSCGATVRLNPNSKTEISRVAILPIEYPSGIMREKIDDLGMALQSELTARGFVVLDPRTVRLVCSTVECPNREKLFTEYQVDALAKFAVKSISKTDFLAGYYNTINGSLQLLDAKDQELIAVEHRESERGGLLFNTGQLAQGIISQARGAGTTSNVESKFIRTLVAKLPEPKVVQEQFASDAVMLRNVETMAAKLGIYRVCIRGTPMASAYIRFGKIRSNLREVAPGRYCGLLPLSKTSRNRAELRSAFGAAVEKEFSI